MLAWAFVRYCLGRPIGRSILRRHLPFEIRHLDLEFEDAPNTCEGHALGGHLRHALHLDDFGAAVPPLTAVGSGRLDNSLEIETAQERRLHSQHVGHLADCVQRRILIVDGQVHVEFLG